MEITAVIWPHHVACWIQQLKHRRPAIFYSIMVEKHHLWY